MQLKSQIIITDDLAAAAAECAEAARAQGALARIWPSPAEPARAATVADIAEIERAAGLKNERAQLFVLAFSELSSIVQNRLLKLLEEPPAGVSFSLLAASKNTLLPTIKSRLIVLDRRAKEPAQPYDIDIRAMSDEAIVAWASPDAPARTCARLLATARAQGIRPDAGALELFAAAYRLAAAAHPSAALLSCALLLALRSCARR